MVGGNVVGALTASGPVIVIASSFTNVAYERLPLDEDEALQMQQSSGGGGAGGQFQDPSSAGLPFFNQLPLSSGNNNMAPPPPQLPVDGWGAAGNSSTGRPPY